MWISVNNLKEILRDFKSKVIDKSIFDTTKTDLEEKINNIDTSTFMDKNTYDTDNDGIVDEAKTASSIENGLYELDFCNENFIKNIVNISTEVND